MFQTRIHRNNQIITRILILILTACSSGYNLIPGAAGGGIRFTQTQLSSLGHQDYGGSAASNSGSGSGSSSSGGSSSGAGSTDTGSTASAGGGEVLVPKSFPLSGQEPTCEELRAMWIFSKRQSRAAEITNEIPTYRDPFAYNIWEPYYSTTRSLGGMRMVPRYGDRTRSPVFGRIISREPVFAPPRMPLRPRHLGDLQSGSTSRIYGLETKPSSIGALPRRQMQFRFGGGGTAGGGNSGAGNGGAATNSVAVQGSFQKLKELIWTERAKELTQQRRAEELAARAAVLKEIANGQNVQANYKHQYNSESLLMDENRSPDQDIYQHPADQQRISIANGQASNGRHSNGASGNTGTATRGGKMQKTAMFSGNSASNTGRAGRLMLPSMVTGSYGHADELTHERGSASMGTAKAFPLRPSHFRERNRSLFKEPATHPDYFRRDQRRFYNLQSMNASPASDTPLQRIIVARLLEAVAPLNRKLSERPIYHSDINNEVEADPQQFMRHLVEKQYNEGVLEEEQDQSQEDANIWDIISTLPHDDVVKSDYSDTDQAFADSLMDDKN